MVRVLLMGRLALEWAAALEDAGADAFALSTARLPAEGIRALEETPPDAVVVTSKDAGVRVRTLVQAIRARPLGALTPILLVCPAPDGGLQAHEVAHELGVEAFLTLESTGHELLLAISEALELSEAELAPPASTPDPATTPRAAEDVVIEDLSDFIVEEVGPDHFTPATTRPVSSVSRASLFPVRAQRVRPGALDAGALRRKLKEVRHEDYYTILEVRRGAEGPVIRQAYQRLVARFDPEALDFELTQRFFRELDEIRDALEDAWAVLGEPSLRDRYMAATSVRA